MSVKVINDLKPGDILHCRGNRLLSKLIMKFTKSRFSHTAIVIECWGQLYVIDAQRNGVNPRPLKEWLKEYGYYFEISRPALDLMETDIKEISIKAFSKVGYTKYDFASLFYYQPRYILTGKWKGKPSETADGRMYCSEYVGWVYNIQNWWKLNPQEIYTYCASNWMLFDTFKIL